MKLKLKKLTVTFLAAITLIGSIGVANPSDAAVKKSMNKIKSPTTLQMLYKGRWYNIKKVYTSDLFIASSYSKDKKYAYGHVYELNLRGYTRFVPEVNFHQMKTRILKSKIGKKDSGYVYSDCSQHFVTKDSIYYKKKTRVNVCVESDDGKRPAYKHPDYYVKSGGYYVQLTSVKVLNSNSSVYIKDPRFFKKPIKGTRGMIKYGTKRIYGGNVKW